MGGYQSIGRQIESHGGTAAILADMGGIVARAEPDIETGVNPFADATLTGEKAMPELGQGAQIFGGQRFENRHGVSGCGAGANPGGAGWLSPTIARALNKLPISVGAINRLYAVATAVA